MSEPSEWDKACENALLKIRAATRHETATRLLVAMLTGVGSAMIPACQVPERLEGLAGLPAAAVALAEQLEREIAKNGGGTDA